MHISHLDHLVLTVEDMERTLEFYRRVLGMTAIVFAGNRKALKFGKQKINLHPAGSSIRPRAAMPQPGSADLCLITDTPMAEILGHLAQCGIVIEEGPVQRSGSAGPIQSVYIRDPDGNLLEIANQL
jgi:catechol 2,3-dioxygenase-like lactoylglutathione lyase family enzyme